MPVTRYEYGRAVECLRTILDRFQDNTFVRNTEHDGEYRDFITSAMKSSSVLAEAQRIVTEYDSERVSS